MKSGLTLVFTVLTQGMYADTLQHSNVREIGAEWICHHIYEELGFSEVLGLAGFSEEQIQLAAT